MTIQAQALSLKKLLQDNITRIEIAHAEISLWASCDTVLSVLEALKQSPHHQFTQLIDVCGVDYLGQTPRFQIVYHLLSIPQNQRVRIKVPVSEDQAVPSAVSLFSSANWWERETFDLMGISFKDHPDLRRILTDYDFEGYPLRKDFPLTGHTEVRYDQGLGRIVHEPVNLDQPFRRFDFESPWEGVCTAVQKDPSNQETKI